MNDLRETTLMGEKIAQNDGKRTRALWASVLLPGSGLLVLGKRRLGLWLLVPYTLFLTFTVYRWPSVKAAFSSGNLEYLVTAIFLLVTLTGLWSYSLAKTLRWGKDVGKTGMSHWEITKNQFRKNKLAVVGMVAGTFHLINHVCYKSCLFLNAGAVLYRTGTRDLNLVGGLAHIMPLTATTALSPLSLLPECRPSAVSPASG